MKALLVTFLVFLTTLCLGQERIQGYVGLTQSANFIFTDTETNLDLGLKLNTQNGSLIVFGNYSYGGVINYIRGAHFQQNFSAFQLDYHLIGGGLKLRYRGDNKLYHPALKVTLSTEVFSKYRGRKLVMGRDADEIIFSPTDWVYE